MQGKAPGLVSDNVTTVGVVNSWLYTIRKLLEDLYGNLKNRLLAAIRSRPDRLQITLSFRPLISSANPISIGSKHPLPGQ